MDVDDERILLRRRRLRVEDVELQLDATDDAIRDVLVGEAHFRRHEQRRGRRFGVHGGIGDERWRGSRRRWDAVVAGAGANVADDDRAGSVTVGATEAVAPASGPALVVVSVAHAATRSCLHIPPGLWSTFRALRATVSSQANHRMANMAASTVVVATMPGAYARRSWLCQRPSARSRTRRRGGRAPLRVESLSPMKSRRYRTGGAAVMGQMGLVPLALRETAEGHEADEGDDDSEQKAPEHGDDDAGNDETAADADARAS